MKNLREWLFPACVCLAWTAASAYTLGLALIS